MCKKTGIGNDLKIKTDLGDIYSKLKERGNILVGE